MTGVRKLVVWHEAGCWCCNVEPDPAMAAYLEGQVRRLLEVNLAAPEPVRVEPLRLPETDLGVLVSASLSLRYLAEVDRRLSHPVGDVENWRPQGFLDFTPAEVVATDRVREHVRLHLVPLVRAAARDHLGLTYRGTGG